MKQQTFALVAGIIFLIIALLHLARLIYGWDAVINGAAIPLWGSIVAVAVAGYLALQGLKLSGKI